MKKLLLVLLLLFSTLTQVYAWETTQTISFHMSDLIFSRIEKYDVVIMKNLGVTHNVGEPQLPLYELHLIIPKGVVVKHIQIVRIKSDTLWGNYLLYPVQQPAILSKPVEEIQFTEPKAEIYNSSTIYPKKIIEYVGNGNLGNNNITSFFIYPIQYVPEQQTLIFHSIIEFHILTQTSHKKFIPLLNPTDAQKKFINRITSKLIANPEDVYEFDNVRATPNSNECQYLIITDKSYLINFQPLASWKTQKGVPSQIITIETIRDNYQGKDDAEKVRHCIQDFYQHYGTIWVLLGGDTKIVPYRPAYAMDSKYGDDANQIPCDLYFADLDGTWDENNNNIYGEVADEIDLLPEVFVGRATVETAYEADTFVRKILTYEKNLMNDYQLKMLFIAQVLWPNPLTDPAVSMDQMAQEYVPSSFKITRLYETLGNGTISNVIQEMNTGYNIINHDGHANTHVMGVNSNLRQYLQEEHIDNLHNDPRNSILFSIGCYPASFDYECIAEHFINNPHGGGVAFIGNSRFGWGSPGNPGFGYSDRYNIQFFKVLFKNKIFHLGEALSMAKAFYTSHSRQENVYRWCMYELNLLGDPEMSVWTDVPASLNVKYPPSIATGTTVIPITVTANDLPVNNALVCIIQGDKIYQYNRTNEQGQVIFKVSDSDPTNNILLTVTAPNCLPYEGSIDVVSEAAYVVCNGYIIDDSQGNGDGLINPGEKVSLRFKFNNYGNQNALSVAATINSADSLVCINNQNLYVGDIAAGDSVESPDILDLSLAANCTNGELLPLNLTLSTSDNYEWNQVLNVICAAPVISFDHYQINDVDNGNGNGIAEPGEKIKLIVLIHNEGLATAKAVLASLGISDQDLVIDPPVSSFGDLSSNKTASGSFTIDIPNNYPSTPSFPELTMNITADEGYSFSLVFKMTIGTTGFTDDMEDGVGKWQTPDPFTNQWHLSSHKSHSGSYSWYCGEEGTWRYQKNSESILESHYFYLSQSAELSFWAWYNVPIYGVNGFYVKIYDGSKWQTLDFIGSGGALDSSLMGNDWLSYTYDLSYLAPGTTVKVQFQWVSDNEPLDTVIVKESGVFIDDVAISSRVSTSIIDEKIDLTFLPTKHKLMQNYPNPFNQHTQIDYQVSGTNLLQVQLCIYNILGEKIRTIVNKKQSGGYYSVNWDGREERGNVVASGIYIYQLKIDNFKTEKKFVMLR